MCLGNVVIRLGAALLVVHFADKEDSSWLQKMSNFLAKGDVDLPSETRRYLAKQRERWDPIVLWRKYDPS